MCELCNSESLSLPRRTFLKTISASAAGLYLGAGHSASATGLAGSVEANRKRLTIRGAFLYPPTKQLTEAGYYSWPGSDFDAEGRHAQYSSHLKEAEKRHSICIDMNSAPLSLDSDVEKFIADLNAGNPDGLILIPLKKHPPWKHIIRILEETRIPTIVSAPLGVFQGSHVRYLNRPGVYMIHSLDNLKAMDDGLRMICTRAWLRRATIVNIDGDEVEERTVPFLGTTVRRIPHQRFYDYFEQAGLTDEVRALAGRYAKGAARIVHPTNADMAEAAKTYFVLKRILEDEKGEALMMNCLRGLARPRKHVPPCMGFMNLLDEGIVTGCEADLDGTLTMMLLMKLCGKPGFLHNSSIDTEKNHYWGAHCTSPSRMQGINSPPDAYELMSHAEAGFGTVPRVLFKEGQEVTIARYISCPAEPEPISAPTVSSRAMRSSREVSPKPQLLLYSGNIVGCPPMPPAGGCRTNVETTINELAQVSDLIGNHMVMIYGNHVYEIKRFCQLYDIDVVV